MKFHANVTQFLQNVECFQIELIKIGYQASVAGKTFSKLPKDKNLNSQVLPT